MKNEKAIIVKKLQKGKKQNLSLKGLINTMSCPKRPKKLTCALEEIQ